MDIISLDTLTSLGFDPKTLLKVQIKVTSVITGSQLDIKGGIFLSFRFQDHSSNRKTVRLFYVASNTSKNYLSCPCLRNWPGFPKDWCYKYQHLPNQRHGTQGRHPGTLHPGTTRPTPLASSNPGHQKLHPAPADHLATTPSGPEDPKPSRASPIPESPWPTNSRQ